MLHLSREVAWLEKSESTWIIKSLLEILSNKGPRSVDWHCSVSVVMIPSSRKEETKERTMSTMRFSMVGMDQGPIREGFLLYLKTLLKGQVSYSLF